MSTSAQYVADIIAIILWSAVIIVSAWGIATSVRDWVTGR